MSPGNPPYEERELLLRIAAGDEAAFRQIYHTYEGLLMPYLTELTKSNHIAEDIVQETMLRIWLNREHISTLEHPRAYIYRMAGNCAFSWLKSRMIRKRVEQDKASLELTVATEVATDLSFQTITRIVQQTIREMPAQRSRIYTMNREQGLKPADIAKALHISVSTVNNTLYQAIKTIREAIEKAGYYLPVWLILFFF